MVQEFLVITIDVECDYDGSHVWRYSDPLTFNGVNEAIPKRLQPLFNKYGAKPTYLISNVVLEDKRSVETFLKLEGDYELGTHLHGEYISPQKRFDKYAGTKNWENQCQYPYEVERQKMANLTRLFRDRFGYQPRSFRAGRFSVGPNTMKILEEFGYKVDTSVTPHMVWRDKTRNLKYLNAPEQPYFPKKGTIMEQGGGVIMEVPVSIKKGIFPLWKNTWLRPTLTSGRNMKKAIRYFKRKYENSGIVVYNIMFHNVEVYPMVSVFTSSEKKCRLYLKRTEDILSFCFERDIKFITLKGLYDIIYQKRF